MSDWPGCRLDAPPALAAGEVHLWRLPAEPPGPSLAAHLSEPEYRRALRFAYPADAAEWTLRRGGLRLLLASYLGQPPSTSALLPIYEHDDGKPYLASGAIRFSSSHTRGLALLAVSGDAELGVDVELVDDDRDFTALASFAFDASTTEGLASMGRRERSDYFHRHWTRLEALGKCRGTGITDNMAFDPHGTEWVVDIAVGVGYSAALAADPRPARIRRFQADLPAE